MMMEEIGTKNSGFSWSFGGDTAAVDGVDDGNIQGSRFMAASWNANAEENSQVTLFDPRLPRGVDGGATEQETQFHLPQNEEDIEGLGSIESYVRGMALVPPNYCSCRSEDDDEEEEGFAPARQGDDNYIVTSHRIRTGGAERRTALRFFDIRKLGAGSTEIVTIKGWFDGCLDDDSSSSSSSSSFQNGIIQTGRSSTGELFFSGHQHDSHATNSQDLSVIRASDGSLATATIPYSVTGSQMSLWTFSKKGDFLFDVQHDSDYQERLRLSKIDYSSGGGGDGGDEIVKREKKRVKRGDGGREEEGGGGRKAVSIAFMKNAHEFNISCICMAEDDSMIATGDSFGSVFLRRTWG
jgi:hypothetical protein